MVSAVVDEHTGRPGRQWNPNVSVQVRRSGCTCALHAKPHNIWNRFDETATNRTQSVFMSINGVNSSPPSHTITSIDSFLLKQATCHLPRPPVTRYLWILIGHLRREIATRSEGSVTTVFFRLFTSPKAFVHRHTHMLHRYALFSQ